MSLVIIAYENISISDKYICFDGGQNCFIVVEPYRFFNFVSMR